MLTYEGLAERHFSLCKLQNRGFLEAISQADLEQYARYMIDDERYGSIEEAMADVEYTAGWDRMYEVRSATTT